MSKELEALERLKNGYNPRAEEDLYIIEKALKQLEDIKENYCVCEKDAIIKLRVLEVIVSKPKKIKIDFLNLNSELNNYTITICDINEKEFNLIKDALLQK